MQIVENRRGHLSRPFLSPEDIFSESYDENRFVWQRYGGGEVREFLWFSGMPLPLLPLRPDMVFVITF